MKGKITLAILEALGEIGADIPDLFEAFLSAGYGASMGKIGYKFSKARIEREKSRTRSLEEGRMRQRYSNIISRLKRDRLIEKDVEKSSFRITLFGKRKRDALRKHASVYLPKTSYKKAGSDNVVIVAFDIPERERSKRNWLRSALKNLGLKMMQRSLWIGKCKIPKIFLEDVRDLKLVEYLEIFEVTKTGTLEHLV